MPKWKILPSPGGSITLVRTEQWKTVKDSYPLPTGDKHIRGLILDNTLWEINQTFVTKEDIVSYLNSTFVLLTGQEGEYGIDQTGFIQYDNVEGFHRIELVMVLATKTLVFKVGDPGYDLVTDDEPIIADNGNEVTDDRLSDKVLSVKMGVQNMEPRADLGYTHSAEGTTLTFANGVQDCYLYVEVSQTI